MWFIGVEVEQETSAPPPKKILDPPLIYMYLLFLSSSFSFSDPSLHFLAAQGEIAKIKEEIDKGKFSNTK